MGEINNNIVLMPKESGFHRAYEQAFHHTTKSITFIVTENCQLRCSYCYQPHKNCEHDMSLETGKRIVDFLFEQDALNSDLINPEKADCLILEFIGGEPLLKIDLIYKIVKYFVKKATLLNHRWKNNYRLSFSSNGIAFFEPDVQKFVEYFKKQISLSITVDGNKELHDSCRRFVDGSPSFDKAVKAFKECLRLGLTTSTKLTIAPANLPYLYDAVTEMLTKYDIIYLAANPVFEEDWTIEHGKEYYSQLKRIGEWYLNSGMYKKKGLALLDNSNLGEPMDEKDDHNWCGGTGAMLAFDSKGDIYPCLRYHPLTLAHQKTSVYVLGNVYTGWVKTEKQIQALKCLQCITRHSQSTDKCFNCPIARGCAWCSGWNYDKFGTPNKRATGICNMHKARVLANNWFWNSIYIKEGMNDRVHLYEPDDWALEIINNEELDMIKSLETK